MQSTIQKWGNSQGVRLPLSILGAVNLTRGCEVDIFSEGENIIIKKAKSQHRKSIVELFEGYDGSCEPVEVDWGKPTGKEIW